MSEVGDPAKTIFCSNCKKDILQANYVIHELHCQRFIFLCSKCNEPVNYKQKDAHDDAKHVLVDCKNCHVQIEKFLLREHLNNDCPHRKLKCQICDIEVSVNDISEHENYCGARTEKCSECGEYVMFKYKQLHIDSNHTFVKLSDEPGPSSSWQNGRCTLGNFIPDIESITRKSQTHQKKKSGKNERKGNSSRADGTASTASVSKEPSDNDRKNKFPIDIDDDAAIARAVEENTAILSEFSLFEPLEKNKTLPGQKLSENTYKGKTGKTVRQPQLYELDDSSDDEFLLYSKKPENDSDCDGLPCQFCGSLYSPYTLMSHQQICDLNDDLNLYLRKKYDRKRFDEDEKEGLITCLICSQLVPFSRYSSHQILHDMAAKN